MDENGAYKLIYVLIPRVIGDLKSISKRITPEGKEWPEEVRAFLRYMRETSDTIEQQHPYLHK